jgi:hypothetical protein
LINVSVTNFQSILIVESKQVHQRKPQQFFVNALSSNAIANHGPNQHKSSCAFLLAAWAKSLKSANSSNSSADVGLRTASRNSKKMFQLIVRYVFTVRFI